MSRGPSGAPPSTRIGDAERTEAQGLLQSHLDAGRLQVTEFVERFGRAANAVTRGRPTARVGGNSSSEPTTELARPGITTSTVPSATSRLSAAAPCTLAAVRPD